jgi:predicted ribonuclease YlaK
MEDGKMVIGVASELVKQITELKEYLAKYAPLKEVEEALLREGTKKILAKPVVLTKDIDEAITANAVKLDAQGNPKKKYFYPLETRQRYARKYYEKNKEAIKAKNTIAMKSRYNTDEEYREKCKQYAENHRKKQKKLLETAQKIIKANEERKQSVFNLLYST